MRATPKSRLESLLEAVRHADEVLRTAPAYDGLRLFELFPGLKKAFDDGVNEAWSEISLPVGCKAHNGEHLATQCDALSETRAIPSGWMAVPVQATLAMHNAAALADIYQEPTIVKGAGGQLLLKSYAPDWSRVWSVMIQAAPSATPHER